ncbi:hypothetical protein HDV02_001005 [Globomyces sp. JEL0801]|nr:hypothetical protein HDV02_001005 [Globomyces sp. JEL0801]
MNAIEVSWYGVVIASLTVFVLVLLIWVYRLSAKLKLSTHPSNQLELPFYTHPPIQLKVITNNLEAALDSFDSDSSSHQSPTSIGTLIQNDVFDYDWVQDIKLSKIVDPDADTVIMTEKDLLQATVPIIPRRSLYSLECDDFPFKTRQCKKVTVY